MFMDESVAARDCFTSRIDTLPTELLRHIRQHTHQNDFAALVRTSRTMHALLEDLLYEHISIEADNLNTAQLKLNRLGRGLRGRPGRALSVKTFCLHICASCLRRSQLDNVSNTEPAGHADMVLTRILSQLLSLTSLTFIYGCCGEDTGLGRLGHITYNHSDTLPRSDVFSAARYATDSMASDVSSNNQSRCSYLPPLASRLPSIESAYLCLGEYCDNFSKLQLMDTNNALASLSLHHFYFDSNSVKQLLSALPSIRQLDLHLLWSPEPLYLTSSIPSSFLDCDTLGQGLRACSETLTSLKLRLECTAYTALDIGNGGPYEAIDESGCQVHNWGTKGSLGSFQNFTNLRHLELAPEVLFGWDDMAETGLNLRQVLPSSLQSLCLTPDFATWWASPWHPETLWPNLVRELFAHGPPSMDLHTVELFYFRDDELQDLVTEIRDTAQNTNVMFKFRESIQS